MRVDKALVAFLMLVNQVVTSLAGKFTVSVRQGTSCPAKNDIEKHRILYDFSAPLASIVWLCVITPFWTFVIYVIYIIAFGFNQTPLPIGVVFVGFALVLPTALIALPLGMLLARLRVSGWAVMFTSLLCEASCLAVLNGARPSNLASVAILLAFPVLSGASIYVSVYHRIRDRSN